MTNFTLTLHFRSDSAQKSHLESAIRELQEKGAHILDIQSKAGKVGEPPTTVNVVTLTYRAPRRIELEEQQS